MDLKLFKDKVTRLDSGIWEVEGLPGGDYDKQAMQYDKLVSNPLYNRIMWGNSPNDYSRFLSDSLAESDGGIMADIGCGSLSFTAPIYAQMPNQDIILCDYSIEMLKIGKDRLEKTGQLSPSIHFLRADALAMPVKYEAFQTVFCFGILHIFDDPSRLVNECKRMLKAGGKLHITSLCSDRKLSSRYLNFLHKKGHVARPMSSEKILQLITESGLTIEKSIVKGGMTYITAYK